MNVTKLQEQFVEQVKTYGGMEIQKEDWPEVQKLIDEGKLEWASRPRGPNNAWRRVIAK